jgi:hypothetical protein
MGGYRERSGDREALIAFLQDTRQFLRAVIEIRHITLPQYLHTAATAAWPEVDAAFDDAVAVLRGDDRQLRRPPPRAFERRGDDLDRELEFFGLAGSQLQLKLASFDATFDELFEAPSFVQVMTAPVVSAVQATARRRKSKLVEWLFPKINSILGSLSKVIPGVDVIKEFKEMAEAGYKESQEQLG